MHLIACLGNFGWSLSCYVTKYLKGMSLLELVTSHSQQLTSSFIFFSPDVALAHLETEKKNSYIKAWEESEKSKVNNK